MGFWMLLGNLHTHNPPPPTQLPTGQLCWKMKCLLQVGTPARAASQLAKPRGLIFYLH